MPVFSAHIKRKQMPVLTSSRSTMRHPAMEYLDISALLWQSTCKSMNSKKLALPSSAPVIFEKIRQIALRVVL